MKKLASLLFSVLFAASASAQQLTGFPPSQTLTNSIAADVVLNNTAAYFDGPSVAQGTSGTWCARGTVTLQDTSAAGIFFLKLTDGTTTVDSAAVSSNSINTYATASLSGCFTNPAGNIKIVAADTTSVSGKIIANASFQTKDSTITVERKY